MNSTSQRTIQTVSTSEDFEAIPAAERLLKLHKQWGNQLVASTSFGLQSSVMLHLISQHLPELPVIFIDTGYLFPETYHYVEKLSNILNINLQVYMPKYSSARIDALWKNVWEQGEVGESRYANITKIEPMSRALSDLNAKAWISGVRRSQSSSRTNKKFLEKQNQIIKAYPILDWSDKQVEQYMSKFELPTHPLKKKGYVTAGDIHSTKPLHEVSSAEETRFQGGKYECGLHLPSDDHTFVI